MYKVDTMEGHVRFGRVARWSRLRYGKPAEQQQMTKERADADHNRRRQDRLMRVRMIQRLWHMRWALDVSRLLKLGNRRHAARAFW